MYSGRIKPYYATFQHKRRRALQSENPFTIIQFRAVVLAWLNKDHFHQQVRPLFIMKKLLTITFFLASYISFAQTVIYGPYLVAPDELGVFGQIGSEGEFWVETEGYLAYHTSGAYGTLTEVEASTISRYMVDNDEGLEFIISDQKQWTTEGPPPNTFIVDMETDKEIYLGVGLLVGVIDKKDRAYALIQTEFEGYVKYVPLGGHSPQYEQRQRDLAARVDTVYQIDTVYINNTTTQIDTVRELITERIFTSDTVYINETITLAGDVDTLVVNRTVTTRDTVYNFTEHTEYITRVDSVYLLGGDYLADLNSVTSVENQLEVEKLSNPYPNPASTTVSIDYVTAVPTANMFLGVYDNQGRRVEQFPVKPSHTITFDVSDWAPGVYVYMIWSPVGVSSTKRLVVQ